MLQGRKLVDFSVECASYHASSQKEPFNGLCLDTGPHVPDQLGLQTLIEWVNSNVCQPRQFRSPQLFLHGPPRTGKTSFLRLLEKRIRVYYMPIDEDFYDEYEDENFDLICFDEFKGQKTIQVMNRWLDGQTMSIRKKGRQGLKRKNLPFIILSNFSPCQCYRKAAEDGRIDSFIDRIKVVEINSMLHLDGIKFVEQIDTNGSPLFVEQ